MQHYIPMHQVGQQVMVLFLKDGKTFIYHKIQTTTLWLYLMWVIPEICFKGFIPVGWYPTKCEGCGKTILVTNGKGLSSKANPTWTQSNGPERKVDRHSGDQSKPKRDTVYLGLLGTLSFIPDPDPGTSGSILPCSVPKIHPTKR